MLYTLYNNKDKNIHRVALNAIRGELLERERERKKEREKKKERERERKEREKKRKIVLGYYTQVTYHP